MLALRKTGGVVGDDVELQDVTGNGRATDAVDWQEGDLLAVGTSSAGGVAQVLSSREAGERKGPKTSACQGISRLPAGRSVLRGSAVDGDLRA
jgi:hypothetical protein